MLRQFITLVLLVAFAAQTFSGAAIICGYYADQTAFAKQCENKARPQLKCHGKCQMMKKLKAEQSKDQQNPERKTESNLVVLFSPIHATTLTFQMIADPGTEYPHFIASAPTKKSYDIFHPPA